MKNKQIYVERGFKGDIDKHSTMWSYADLQHGNSIVIVEVRKLPANNAARKPG